MGHLEQGQIQGKGEPIKEKCHRGEKVTNKIFVSAGGGKVWDRDTRVAGGEGREVCWPTDKSAWTVTRGAGGPKDIGSTGGYLSKKKYLM